jgi:hypothetical protein
MSARSIVIGFCVVAGVVAVGAAVSEHMDKKREAAHQKRIAEDSVVALPPGVEEAWIRHVDERMRARFEPRASAIRIRYDERLESKSVLVSLNMPYTVECSPELGGSIAFGSGEQATVVSVYGLLDLDGQEPDLGVSTGSIAARRLHERLCDHIQSVLAMFMKR